MTRYLPIVAALVGASTGDAASPTEAAEKAAIESAQAWLKMIDAGNYAESWNEAAFENKKAVETVTPTLEKDGKWRVSGYYIK